MIEELATVTAIDGSNIQVESQVTSTCSSCQQVDTCGSGQISKAIPHKALKVTLPNKQNFKIGDQVVIGIPQEQLLSSAWQVYGLPLLGLIVFAFIGELTSQSFGFYNEILTVIFAFFGGWSGFKLASWLQMRPHCQAALLPKILRKHAETINVVQIQP